MEPDYCGHFVKAHFYICRRQNVSGSRQNGTAHYENCKQLLKCHNYLLLRDIWWLRYQPLFKCCLFFQHYSKYALCQGLACSRSLDMSLSCAYIGEVYLENVFNNAQRLCLTLLTLATLGGKTQTG